jgi:hypothetical protein
MLVASGLLLPVFLAFAVQAPTDAPARGPLTEAEVVFLLQSGVTPVRVRALVERHGVELELSEKVLALVREAGADAPLLEALRRRAAPQPPAMPAPVTASPRAARAAPATAPPRGVSAAPATASPSASAESAPAPTSQPTGARAQAALAPVSPLEPDVIEVPGGPTGTLYFARFEVTNRQYLMFCSRTSRPRPAAPYWGRHDRYPVVNVTWQDASAYCRWLAKETGRPYRLPTAGEWEHAARGGVQVPGVYPWGDEDPLGRSCFGKGLLCPVGSYKPNAYGLHDLAGSVAEWCGDGQGDSRFVKGGSWATPVVSPEKLAIATRDELGIDKARNEVGFRVVRAR